MNKIYFYLLIIAAGFFAVSCESDYVAPHDTVETGPFVKFGEITSSSMNPSDPNSTYSAEIQAPSNNVTSYRVIFDFIGANDTVQDVFLKELTSFPSNLSMSVPEIENAAGLAPGTIGPGDRIDVNAVTKNAAGEEFTAANLGADLNNPGQRQAFMYSVFFLCPWVQADAVGQYLIVRDDFDSTLDPGRLIDCVAGPEDNEVTFINIFSHPEEYDVTFTVTDADLAQATVNKQAAWHCDNFGCPYGEGSVEGSGLFFSCTGFVTVDLANTVAAGSFGTYRLELQKQN